MDEADGPSTLSQLTKVYKLKRPRWPRGRPCYLCLENAVGLLCTACWQGLHSEIGNPLTMTLSGSVTVYAVCRYAYPLNRLIQRAKFEGDVTALSLCGSLLKEVSIHLHDVDCVVPVPLSRRRFWRRGYNQAAEIARPLASALVKPTWDKLLVKRLHRPQQSELPAAKRRHNVANSFAVQSRLDGQHVLLVDDVVTTGATVLEAARVLRHAGAGRITVACVALA